jgi:short-subunit dehydrogenase
VTTARPQEAVAVVTGASRGIGALASDAAGHVTGTTLFVDGATSA